MSNENVTRVTADATGYTTELDRASRSAKAFAESNEAASRRVAAAQQAVTEATVNGSAASARSITSFISSVSRQADAAGKTRAELLRMQAAQLGVSAAAEDSIAKIEAAAAASTHAGAAAHEFSLGSVAARRELAVLAHEASQGNWKNFGGSLMVLAERTDALSLAMSPAGLAVGILAAALAGAVYEVVQGNVQFEAFQKAITSTNGALGLSANQLIDISARLVDTKTSLSSARETLALLADTGRFTGSNLELAGRAAVAMAEDTGESAADAVKSLTKLQENVMEWLTAYQAQHHVFSAAQIDEIDGFVRAGNAAAAQKAVMIDLVAAHETVAASAVKSTGIIATGWRDILEVVAMYKAALLNIGVPDGIGKQIGDELERVEAAQRAVQSQTASGNNAMATRAREQLAIEMQKLNVLRDQQKAVWDTNAASAKRAAGGDAALRVDNYISNPKYASPSDKHKLDLSTEQKDFDAATVGIDQSSAKYQTALQRHLDNVQKINDDFAKSQHKAGAENGMDAALAALQGNIKLREDALKDGLARTKSLLDRGLIDTQTAYQQSSDQRQAVYRDELAFVTQQEEIAKGKKQLKALVGYQTQKALIEQKMLEDQRQNIDAQEKVMESNISKVAQYVDVLSAKLATAQNAGNISVAAVGTGSLQTDQASRLNALQQEYNQQYASLQKSMQEHPQDAAVYRNQLDALNSYQEARVALELSTNDRLAAARADWSNGWNRALEDYQNQAADKASQTATVFNDATRGMEDVWVNFVTTGKLSFSSLATSVISDIARIQARAAIASGSSWLLGVLSSTVGAFAGSFGTLASTDSAAAAAGSVLNSGYSAGISGPSGMMPTYSYKAAGGQIVGPGTGTSDSVPIMASNGEGVLTAAAMKKLGVDNLNALNNGASIDRLARFASGGVVGSSAMSAVSGTPNKGGDVSISISAGQSNASGAGYTPAELASLKSLVQGWVDQRIARKSSGQGGLGYNLRNGLAS